MSNLLMTAQEIINLAVQDKDFNASKIKPLRIEAAQFNYIRPALTEKLYNRVLDELSEAADSGPAISEAVADLIEKIKPALAYFVIFDIIPETFLQITNKGGQKPVTEFSRDTSKDERDTLRASYQSSGNTFLSIMVREIERAGNTVYPEYENFCEVREKTRLRGGIILTRKKI